MSAKRNQLVYVKHNDCVWPAAIAQAQCPQDPTRLGGEHDLVDVSLLEAIVPEDNGDPNYERTKAARTEYKIVQGLSNLKRARNAGERVNGTWWDRTEDDAQKGA